MGWVVPSPAPQGDMPDDEYLEYLREYRKLLQGLADRPWWRKYIWP